MICFSPKRTEPTPYTTILMCDIEITTSIVDQKKILATLEPIDKKIANNSAINNNLQAQAQAIYEDLLSRILFPRH